MIVAGVLPRPSAPPLLIPLLAVVALRAFSAALATPPDFERADGAAVNGQVVQAPAAPAIQRLAILPDRTTGRDWGLRYLRQAVDDLNRAAPDAVFTVGDMIQGYTRDADEWQRQVDEYFGIVRGLQMPLYPVAGNHDVWSGTRVKGDEAFAQRYRRAFGPLWYRVDLERITVIAMFSDEALGDGGLRVGDEQLAWLDGTLAGADARGKPIIVLMHRPLWRSASVRWPERVQPLLARHHVKAVIAGHFHSMQRDVDVDGVQYHIVGVCGGMIDQHPYAGQMQHLTFVDVAEDGALRFHHAAVGCTVPDDWVLRVDQDRVFDLRDKPNVLRWKSAFPDPFTASAVTAGQAELEFRNPLDVPVHVSLEQIRTEPTPWLVGRENFVSWTPVDVFNPETTALEGPFDVSAVSRQPVAPGEATRIPVRLRAAPVGEPGPPAPIEFRVEVVDRAGRTVPVVIPIRLPLQRIITLRPTIEDAPPYPLCVWAPSPYDTLDPNPTARLALDRSDAGDHMIVEVRVADTRPSAFEPDDRSFEARRADPIADAVRVVINAGERRVECLTEPFAHRSFGDPCTAEAPKPWPDGKGWTQRIRVPWPGGRFDGSARPTLNVGVADNDDTYHTQWRWLAPADFPAALRVDEPSPTPR